MHKIRQLAIITRIEFLPANLCSLIMGFAWAYDVSAVNVPVLNAFLAFLILSVVSAFGAQFNTLSDIRLDANDPGKKWLTEAVKSVGIGNIKKAVVIEILIGMILAAIFTFLTKSLVLLILILLGAFLGYAYSMPPLRLKARSYLAMSSLILVLSTVPLLFVYYTFTDRLDPLFMLFLIGQGITVYSIIIPTEIRDYFTDKKAGVRTFTVYLGLVKASLLAITLLCMGFILSGTAFVLAMERISPYLSLFLTAMLAADAVVIKGFVKLLLLSGKYAKTGDDTLARQIVKLAEENPKWITIVSMSVGLVSAVLLIGKMFG